MKTLPLQIKHTDGRVYRVVRLDPLVIEVLKAGTWTRLKGNPTKLSEIRRAYERRK